MIFKFAFGLGLAGVVSAEAEWRTGFCTLNGADQNSGVIKINDVDGNTEEAQAVCMTACQEHPDATGCEVVWDQGNRGCYIHTEAITEANGRDRHLCSIFTPTAGWEQHDNAHCFVTEKEYPEDKLHNPIIGGGNGGGNSVGKLTRSDCMQRCMETSDEYGRPCVAIEMRTSGEDDGSTSQCFLAWGCEIIGYWSSGSVFLPPAEETPAEPEPTPEAAPTPQVWYTVSGALGCPAINTCIEGGASHGCEDGCYGGQCCWSSLEDAKEYCGEWDECEAFYGPQNGKYYARGDGFTGPLTDGYADMTGYIKIGYLPTPVAEGTEGPAECYSDRWIGKCWGCVSRWGWCGHTAEYCNMGTNCVTGRRMDMIMKDEFMPTNGTRRMEAEEMKPSSLIKRLNVETLE